VYVGVGALDAPKVPTEYVPLRADVVIRPYGGKIIGNSE